MNSLTTFACIAALVAANLGTAQERRPYASAAEPTSLSDVKMLAKAGVSDEVILSQIRNTHAVFQLSTADILDLKETGVSERVIDFMINSPNMGSPAAPVAEAVEVAGPPPPPPPRAVEEVIVSPGPDYVWIGGAWTWSGGRWVWGRGRWVLPPHRAAIWVPGRWERHHGRGVWFAGHWR